MVRFLRAVGFTDAETDRDLMKSMFIAATGTPDSIKKTGLKSGEIYCEIRKKFFNNGGIVIAGKFDEKELFHTDYYFPFLESSIITFEDTISVPDIAPGEFPYATGHDERIGTDINFFMQDMLEYYSVFLKTGEKAYAKIYLSGLSRAGIIIMGTAESSPTHGTAAWRTSKQVTAEVSERIKKEDIYTIVETMFRPGSEDSECYTVLGNITNWSIVRNSLTGEEIVILLLECCDMLFPVAINRKDLYGVPAIGRRFKGYVWMQGKAEFDEMETS